ncbi:hypothetical protein [Metabacillus sp. Hm71]
MYYETWAWVWMGLGVVSLWILLAAMVMSIMIAASRADDRMGEKQYDKS